MSSVQIYKGLRDKGWTGQLHFNIIQTISFLSDIGSGELTYCNFNICLCGFYYFKLNVFIVIL